ncbi:hypothetical protein [Spiroplasma endosymbiont of Phycita roborella]|uniref:hypothetical protein n=1 Tax=Spiroplasma endosymbiont of Phycita roborella TaxID=3066311 RepID=UPI00313B1473
MNKEKLIQYYDDKLKQHEKDLEDIRLNERLIANILMDAKCMIERIIKGEFDE